ncbi:serine--tRNA ligase [Candidatus Dependentiae bacterium]|nr:serine--tRNA ligase [Candidatus Dependentiae bacterium]
MIDLVLLRNNPEEIIVALKKKEPAYDAQRLYELDGHVRTILLAVEQLRSKKNELVDRAKGGIIDAIRQESIVLGKELEKKERELERVKKDFFAHYLECPNLLDVEVPAGDKNHNKVIKVFGKQTKFTFPVKHHVDLVTAAGWIDFEAGVRVSGSQFVVYKGDAVRLLYALTMFMLKHNQKYGFELVLPPYLVNEESLTVSSNLPKFKDQIYELKDDGLFLTPTAEVNLASMYRDHIFDQHDLPIRMTSWTSCFRREAGGYGATERGLIRMHQFEKVELYTLCIPEASQKEQERMLACAEELLQRLGLHYRVSLLAAQDCSFPSAKTYDIEVWLPGQKEYYEVSSVSNCTDFQARRGMIRYKDSTNKKQLVHTLNGSSLALSRLMVALVETYQNADGSITIPDVLKKEALF